MICSSPDRLAIEVCNVLCKKRYFNRSSVESIYTFQFFLNLAPIDFLPFASVLSLSTDPDYANMSIPIEIKLIEVLIDISTGPSLFWVNFPQEKCDDSISVRNANYAEVRESINK